MSMIFKAIRWNTWQITQFLGGEFHSPKHAHEWIPRSIKAWELLTKYFGDTIDRIEGTIFDGARAGEREEILVVRRGIARPFMPFNEFNANMFKYQSLCTLFFFSSAFSSLVFFGQYDVNMREVARKMDFSFLLFLTMALVCIKAFPFLDHFASFISCTCLIYKSLALFDTRADCQPQGGGHAIKSAEKSLITQFS
jgi:hypothetical protein